MQEVAKLRRSLDDAEGLSRDTKKDWAVLRTQNIALEEMNVSGIHTQTFLYSENLLNNLDNENGLTSLTVWPKGEWSVWSCPASALLFMHLMLHLNFFFF